MVFEETFETLTITRKVPAIGYANTTYETVGSTPGRIEPVAGDEEFLNNQNFQGVTEVAFCPIEADGKVSPDDVLIDSRGVKRINRGVPEVWRHLMPYVMLRLERSQYVE